MSEPIWKSPGWLTAIAGIITALITIPEQVGNYLSKMQDIEKAKVEQKSLQLKNTFQIVNNTLAQQGEERVFILRYLAATLENQQARNWAESEIALIDQINETEAELKQVKKQLAALSNLPDDAKGIELPGDEKNTLQAEKEALIRKRIDLERTADYQRAYAGILSGQKWHNYVFDLMLKSPGDADYQFVLHDGGLQQSESSGCWTYIEDFCRVYVSANFAPEFVYITGDYSKLSYFLIKNYLVSEGPMSLTTDNSYLRKVVVENCTILNKQEANKAGLLRCPLL